MKITRYATLCTCYELLYAHMRTLSINGALIAPLEGCEGAFDLYREHLQQLREMMQEERYGNQE